MALSMLDKADVKTHKLPWPADIAAECEREAKNPKPCVSATLRSENERTRGGMSSLARGERIGIQRQARG